MSERSAAEERFIAWFRTARWGRMRRRDRLMLTVASLAIAAGGVVVGVPGAYGGFIGRTGNPDTAATAAYFTCAGAATGDTLTKAYFAYPFGETAGPSASDVTGNNRTGTYNGTVGYGVNSNSGTGAVCARDKKTVISLNGNNAYVSGPNSTLANPTTFSEEIWFKSVIPQGRLIGFGNARTGASASATVDRQLYIDIGGFVRFGIYPTGGTRTTIQTARSMIDNKWHQAVGTLSSVGMRLYIDGALVASNAATTPGNYTGYWKVGYDDLSGWPGGSLGNYFNGSLAFASVYTYALSSTQVANHYAAGL